MLGRNRKAKIKQRGEEKEDGRFKEAKDGERINE